MTDGSNENLDLVRRQFGANADAYGISEVHARGASLARLIDGLELDSNYDMLDVATGGGSVALASAPLVKSVVASDATPQMLEVVERRAKEEGISNLQVELADAHQLPFADASWDVVTCRIAPHHFHDPNQFVAEVARTLRPGGLFGLVDNVVPDNQLVADFANDWERKRDPSHTRCLSVNQWLDLLVAHGFDVEHRELLSKEMGFSWWCDNMSVTAETRIELLDELQKSSEEVQAFLRPYVDEPPGQDTTLFYLTEVVLVARKAA